MADFTYCSTWSGIVYVAFLVDAFSRRIVGCKTVGDCFDNAVARAHSGGMASRSEASPCGLMGRSLDWQGGRVAVLVGSDQIASNASEVAFTWEVRLARQHLTIEWQSSVLLPRVPRSR